MHKSPITLIVALALATLACAVPGVTAMTPTPSAPTATADVRLPTIVAETFIAAVTQTFAAIPPTLTPTATPEPPTATPTVTATLSISSTLSALEDLSAFFTDERGGYVITIPTGWLVMRPNQQEHLDALSAAEATNPLLFEALKALQNEKPEALRLFAVNTDSTPAPAGKEPLPTIKLVLDETRGISFNSDQDLQAIAAELETATPGLAVRALDILITPGGMQFGAIESTFTDANGMTIFEKRVYFKGKTGVVYAWLTVGESLKNELIPVFDAIMDTIRMSE